MTGKCHSCHRGYPNRDEKYDWAEEEYPTRGFTPKAIEEELPVFDDVVDKKESGKFVASRGITSNVMEFYGVKTYGEDRQEYPYPSGGIKVRKFPKEFYAKNGFRGNELFGMNLFPAGSSKMVTVVEGEVDAMSAFQMLSQGSSYKNPVVSLPSATPSGKLWEKTRGWLESFDKIILSVDNDEPGRKVAERVSLMFPGKVRVMDHGQYKDANEFLQAGKAKEYKSAWWAAKPFRPSDMLVDSCDYLELYEESPDFEYFETGIPELDEKILGINKGYFTVIQAPTGIGKSEFMRYLEWRCLTKSPYKFAFMHLEESKLRSILGLVSYDLQDNLTLKKFIDEKGRNEDVKESIKRLSSDERMLQFSFNPEDGYESLLDKIKFMKAAFDVDYVFFEPIQDLVHGEDKEGKLADLSSRLGTMATELDVGIITIAHQNQNGDTMYATMIGKKAAFEITLHRDQESEDVEERNRTYIKVGRKNRVGLGNGPAGALDFNHESYTLSPVLGPKEPKTPNKGDLPF
jgi:twinkle protein